MMLAQTKRGEKVERHRRDQIVILRRADVRAIMRVARLQAGAKIFPVIRRTFHITSIASRWRGRSRAARSLVSLGTQARRANGQIDRCASWAVREKEMREVYRRRARPSRPGRGMLVRPEHKDHS